MNNDNYTIRNIFITCFFVLPIIIGGGEQYLRKQEVLAKEDETPVATATPEPKITVVSYRVVEPTPKPLTVEGKIRATFGENHIMEKVAFCESSFNPGAKSKISTAKGLYQVINGTWKHYGCTGDPLNADDNIKCAKKIYDKRGLKDWYASQHCWGK